MKELNEAEKLLRRLRDQVLGPELPDITADGALEGMHAELAVAFEEIDAYFGTPGPQGRFLRQKLLKKGRAT